MRKWLLTICLMFINVTCKAGDCFDLAGRDYKIDPDLLRAISWKESRNRLMPSVLIRLGIWQWTYAGRFPAF